MIKLANILHIEKDKNSANALKLLLEKEGFNVHLAHSGKNGLIKIKRKHFDLVLLDIMLPDMSAWDFFQKLKKSRTKCAFLSTIPLSKEKIKELKKAGVSDYIVSNKDITKRIRSIIS